MQFLKRVQKINTKLFPFRENVPKFGSPVIITLPRSFVTAVLASVFILAFIITDYWNIPDPDHYQVAILAGTIALGIVWSLLAGSDVKFEINMREVFSFALLLVVLFILNYRSLGSVIPWRGDEDRHIIYTLQLNSQFPWYGYIFFLAWVLILYLAWQKPRLAIIAGAFFLWQILLSYPPDSLYGDLRYPYINYWIYALALHPAMLVISPYHEILFRIVPFLSVVGIAWFFQRSLDQKEYHTKVLWGLSAAVIPIVFYYSSVLYLEMPAIFLMTIVCMHIGILLRKDFVELKQDIGWYALILIGFIKETTLPFLLCFLIYRTAISLWHRIQDRKFNRQTEVNAEAKPKSSNGQFIKGELSIYFVTLLPIVYYLLFRTIFDNTREYALTISNLLDLSIYSVMARSFFEQFGVFLFLFIGGCIFLFKKKDYLILCFYLILIIGYALFYMLDQNEYIGYSRFNLFYLPPILAGSSFLIRAVFESRKLYGTILAILTILSSLLLSPIHYDGTKVPLWGNYFTDTSEHYYPVEEALIWLKQNDPDGTILFAGLYYNYFFDFYFNKIDWQPSEFDVYLSDKKNQDDDSNLSKALINAENHDYKNVLFFVLGEDIPQIPEESGFNQQRIFNNTAHSLVLYSRKK